MLSLIGGYRPAAIVSAAARLSVMDHLVRGVDTIDRLADATGARPDRLTVLLHALVAFGLLRQREDHSYAPTVAGSILCSGHPASLHDSALYAGAVSLPAFACLADGMTQDATAFELAFGEPFYAVVNNDKAKLAAFTGMLAEPRLGTALADAWNFSGVRQLVDVGGGDGAVLVEVLRRHPGLSGIVFDLKSMNEGMDVAQLPNEVKERLHRIDGDFAQCVPPAGDAYLLCRVLANWPDEAAAGIIRRVAEGIRPGGVLLIVEQLLPSAIVAGSSVAAGSLDLMVNFGGRLRTAEEFGSLLDAGGLVLGEVRALMVDGGPWHVIIASAPEASSRT